MSTRYYYECEYFPTPQGVVDLHGHKIVVSLRVGPHKLTLGALGEKRIDPLRDWCIEQFGPHYRNEIWRQWNQSSHFYFSDKSYAMLMVMKWQGTEVDY